MLNCVRHGGNATWFIEFSFHPNYFQRWKVFSNERQLIMKTFNSNNNWKVRSHWPAALSWHKVPRTHEKIDKTMTASLGCSEICNHQNCFSSWGYEVCQNDVMIRTSKYRDGYSSHWMTKTSRQVKFYDFLLQRI